MSILASLAKLVGKQKPTRTKLKRAERFKTVGFATPFGEVRDLSSSGMRIFAPRKPKLEVGQRVEMRLSSAFQQVVVAAKVVWVRNDQDQWQVGFQFVDMLPAVREAVEHLAKHGFAEMGAGPGPRRSGQSGVGTQTSQNSHTTGKSIGEQALLYEDLYAMFSLKPDATDEEVQVAYRFKARELHPDHNTAPDADQQFSRLTKAYSILKDPEKRKRYDEMRAKNAA